MITATHTNLNPPALPRYPERNYARIDDAIIGAQRAAIDWGETAYVVAAPYTDGVSWFNGYDVLPLAGMLARGISLRRATHEAYPNPCPCGSGLPVGDDGQCICCWSESLSELTPPRFGIGAVVRVPRMKRSVFIVRGQRYDVGCGWVYKLETITGRSWGWETERELAPHTNRKQVTR
jgi:hypothetical protein